jgi:tryptophan-rich sensory protein
MSNFFKLIISIVVPLTVAFTASLFTITGVGSWYQTISKPSWNPPSWIFAPVWTILYVLMGIAFFLVWRSAIGKDVKRPAIILFMLQLIANFFWSFIFFNQHLIALAFAEIIILWLLILLTIF